MIFFLHLIIILPVYDTFPSDVFNIKYIRKFLLNRPDTWIWTFFSEKKIILQKVFIIEFWNL